MTLRNFYLNRICDFIKIESPEIWRCNTKIGWRNRIDQHMGFNTLCVMWDKNNIAGVGMFNVNGEVANIYCTVVGKHYRRTSTINQMVLEGFKHYPYLKTVEFCRITKYNDERIIRIPITKFTGV